MGQLPRVVAGRGPVIPFTGHFLLHFDLLLLLDTGRDDVHGAADRWEGKLAGAQPALYLDPLRDHIQAEPVRPVYPAVFHIIHRYPVDHYSDIPLAETADIDARIAVTPALLGGINTGRGVEDHGNILRCQLFLELQGLDRAERHRRLPRTGHVANHFNLAQHNGLQVKIKESAARGYRDFLSHRFITHVRSRNIIGACRK